MEKKKQPEKKKKVVKNRFRLAGNPFEREDDQLNETISNDDPALEMMRRYL